MKTRSLTAIIAAATIFCSCGGHVGGHLPAWKAGELDIHFINTARGECTYQILPDGTTFMVDAAGSFWNYDRQTIMESVPSPDITSGKVIVDYVNHFSPSVSKGHINYFLLTHRKADHLGGMHETVPLHESGRFYLTSLPEIGSSLVLDKILDRDPDFTYPTPASLDTTLTNNYRAFLDWTTDINGSKVEKWRVGSSTQVVPLHDPSCGVSLRSYSGNGWFWTGEGEEEAYTTMPTTEELEAGDPKAIPTEYYLSCSYILSYGDFDFFLGGDLQYTNKNKYSYLDVEAPVAKVAHKVEVMKANNHGCRTTHSVQLMSALRPDVWVANVWCDTQVTPSVVDRVLKANPNCEIFCTNMTRQIAAGLGEGRLGHVVSQFGHVVVRVARDGKSYMVYVLNDEDQKYTINEIHGPYQCAE